MIGRGMGAVTFNTDINKTVDLSKTVTLTVNKTVTSVVNLDGQLATAEASADALGENTLAETDTFAQVGPDGAFSFSESLAASQGEPAPLPPGTGLYFRANDGTTGGEPWRVAADGSVVRVADINPGADGSGPFGFTEFADELYFSAFDGRTGRELWKVAADGRVVQVADINPGADDSNPGAFLEPVFTEFAGELYFSADDGTTGFEPWKVAADGSVIQVADINPRNDAPFPFINGSRPSEFTEFAGELYFRADDGATGSEPWKVAADGRVVRVADINPGADGSFPEEFTEFADELNFSPDDGRTGSEPWKVAADGRVVQVADINPGAGNSSASEQGGGGFTEFAGELYFSANDGTTGFELWKVAADGQVVRVADINPGAATSFPGGFTEFADELYFRADDGATGFEPWKVTADGRVVQVADINPGADGSNPGEFTEFAGELYFGADNGTTGAFEPWKVAGNGSVVQVADIFPGTPGSTGTGFDFTVFDPDDMFV